MDYYEWYKTEMGINDNDVETARKFIKGHNSRVETAYMIGKNIEAEETEKFDKLPESVKKALQYLCDIGEID